MTQWGMALLVVFVALGATNRLTWRQAGGVGLVLTVIVIGAVLVRYSTTTPADQYIPAIDSTIDQTGYAAQAPPLQGLPAPSTENHLGLQGATWGTTDHSTSGLGLGSGG